MKKRIKRGYFLDKTYISDHNKWFVLKTFLLAARRKGYGPSVNYIISIDPIEIDKSSTNYIGRLKPGANASNFTIYDCGSDAKDALDVSIRREFGYILYVKLKKLLSYYHYFQL